MAIYPKVPEILLKLPGAERRPKRGAIVVFETFHLSKLQPLTTKSDQLLFIIIDDRIGSFKSIYLCC